MQVDLYTIDPFGTQQTGCYREVACICRLNCTL